MRLPKMDEREREAFLAAPRVGVFAVGEDGRGPCAVPVWYAYEPGGALRITAGRTSRKVRLVQLAGRASLCVQREALPPAYVSVEGPVQILQDDPAELQRHVAERYLGPEGALRYLDSFGAALRDEVTLVLQPERWWTADFSKPMP